LYDEIEFVLLSLTKCENMLYIGNEMALVMGRRSLKVISVDDYSESSANHSHDPSKNKAGGGNGGRKG
jgi:hypothetical protein